MGEVKTQPVNAVVLNSSSELRDKKIPGSVCFSRLDDDGTQFMSYVCPCGCGRIAPITVGNVFKPNGPGATWNWNGSLTKPDLKPSVHHVGHWHGWLRDGVWVSC